MKSGESSGCWQHRPSWREVKGNATMRRRIQILAGSVLMAMAMGLSVPPAVAHNPGHTKTVTKYNCTTVGWHYTSATGGGAGNIQSWTSIQWQNGSYYDLDCQQWTQVKIYYVWQGGYTYIGTKTVNGYFTGTLERFGQLTKTDHNFKPVGQGTWGFAIY